MDVLHTSRIEVGDEIVFTADYLDKIKGDTGIVMDICAGCNGVVLRGEREHYSFDAIAVYQKGSVKVKGIRQEEVFKFLRSISDVVFLNQLPEGTINVKHLQSVMLFFLDKGGLKDRYFEWLRK